jgi:hypothetical protein
MERHQGVLGYNSRWRFTFSEDAEQSQRSVNLIATGVDRHD